MKYSGYFLLLMLLVFFGCSTQKNTMVTRTYHNVTAYYNVYWNGKQAYRSGMERIEKNYRDNYTYVLPVFLHGLEETSAMVGSDMQRVISKSAKCIKEHSIKVKPEKLQGRTDLSEEEREFYNQNEYNKWVDDAYLLIAKAHLHNMDFTLSAQTLRFMLNEFSHDPEILYSTNIWLVRVQNMNGNFRESREILERLSNRDEFEPLLNGEYYKTYADFHLKQRQYPQTIHFLEKALAEERRRRNRMRYNFILGQLHQQVGQYEQASGYYRRVIRMNPPYEMAFNAKLSRAFTHSAGAGNVKEIEQDLLKMLDNENNRDFKDQIYYALGQLMYRDGNEDKALAYYKLSSSNSVDNNNQKTTSLLAIAEIYFDRNAYPTAGTYYDSVDMFISEDYPDYKAITEKTEVFIRLVRSLNTIVLEDSLQHLASLSEGERMRVVDAAIREHVERERREQQLERQRMQQMAHHAARTGQDQMGSGQAWYFYNTNAIARGKQEFTARWGDRKLEDHWRRSNKQTIAGFSDAMTVAELREEQEQEAEKVDDPRSREYYLQHIPLTDSALEESHKKLRDAYMVAGSIYKEDLNDYGEAIKIYEAFLARYPDDEMVLLTMYNLYRICQEVNDQACVEKYKRKIIQKDPNSMFAKVILDPSYLLELQQQQEGVNVLFEQTLTHFKAERYRQVLMLVDEAHEKYPDKGSHLKQFDYLRILSLGKLETVPVFRKALREYIVKYPQSEQAEQAQLVLAYLDREHPELVREERLVTAQATYSKDITGRHYFVMDVPAQTDTNQLRFNFINFHLDYFDEDYTVSYRQLDEHRLVLLVQPIFVSKEVAMPYYRLTQTHRADVLREIEADEVHSFIITEANFDMLLKEKDGFAYEQFFRKHYLE